MRGEGAELAFQSWQINRREREKISSFPELANKEKREGEKIS